MSLFLFYDKALNEIGKLGNEMKTGFIEVENQLNSSKEQMSGALNQVIQTMNRFSTNVEKGFLAIEEAMEEDVTDIKDEISSIKERLDRGNL